MFHTCFQNVARNPGKRGFGLVASRYGCGVQHKTEAQNYFGEFIGLLEKNAGSNMIRATFSG